MSSPPSYLMYCKGCFPDIYASPPKGVNYNSLRREVEPSVRLLDTDSKYTTLIADKTFWLHVCRPNAKICRQRVKFLRDFDVWVRSGPSTYTQWQQRRFKNYLEDKISVVPSSPISRGFRRALLCLAQKKPVVSCGVDYSFTYLGFYAFSDSAGKKVRAAFVSVMDKVADGGNRTPADSHRLVAALAEASWKAFDRGELQFEDPWHQNSKKPTVTLSEKPNVTVLDILKCGKPAAGSLRILLGHSEPDYQVELSHQAFCLLLNLVKKKRAATDKDVVFAYATPYASLSHRRLLLVKFIPVNDDETIRITRLDQQSEGRISNRSNVHGKRSRVIKLACKGDPISKLSYDKKTQRYICPADPMVAWDLIWWLIFSYRTA